eukprot:CAMPEP_0184481660 /NCGR_PEP_ID=MMETSP0113_2-20130426/3219_1 /TAXON_ID=91329 /ORGANISM="Norrisiella sphaerica, Strain BC52" /LENGTH=211 /DNA_ID=CAMNT_0026860911 /DNA_START=651 /DNA_END=1283 /DNA_ORIENTATION=-
MGEEFDNKYGRQQREAEYSGSVLPDQVSLPFYSLDGYQTKGDMDNPLTQPEATKGGSCMRKWGKPLPKDWKMLYTDKGTPYYVNNATNKSQWRRPTTAGILVSVTDLLTAYMSSKSSPARAYASSPPRNHMENSQPYQSNQFDYKRRSMIESDEESNTANTQEPKNGEAEIGNKISENGRSSDPPHSIPPSPPLATTRSSFNKGPPPPPPP